jgi:acetate kinase
VSGISGEVARLIESDAPAAADAIALFTFSAAREVAALATTLGGLDQIVFTGGIGEHAWQVRSAIIDRLAWLGITLDDAANRASAPCVSSPTSAIRVTIVPTDEEGVIARHTATLLHASATR